GYRKSAGRAARLLLPPERARAGRTPCGLARWVRPGYRNLRPLWEMPFRLGPATEPQRSPARRWERNADCPRFRKMAAAEDWAAPAGFPRRHRWPPDSPCGWCSLGQT